MLLVSKKGPIRSRFGNIVFVLRPAILILAMLFVLKVQNSTQALKVLMHIITASSCIIHIRMAHEQNIETYNEAEWHNALHDAFWRNDHHHHLFMIFS